MCGIRSRRSSSTSRKPAVVTRAVRLPRRSRTAFVATVVPWTTSATPTARARCRFDDCEVVAWRRREQLRDKTRPSLPCRITSVNVPPTSTPTGLRSCSRRRNLKFHVAFRATINETDAEWKGPPSSRAIRSDLHGRARGHSRHARVSTADAAALIRPLERGMKLAGPAFTVQEGRANRHVRCPAAQGAGDARGSSCRAASPCTRVRRRSPRISGSSR